MEYHLVAEVVPPCDTPDLDPLQRQGVVSLLHEQLDLLAGIEGPDGMEIEPLDHRVTARPDGASITWIVDAPALSFAEEAARHVLDELLERVELLDNWTVTRCEVTVSDDELATALAEDTHDFGAEFATNTDLDLNRRREELLRCAIRLRAFGMDYFGFEQPDTECAVLCAGALVQAVEVLTEELFQDVRTLEETDATADDLVDLWVIGELPRRFAHCYTALFAKKFLVAMTVLGHRLTIPEWTPPLSTAETLALHVIKSRAVHQLQLDGLLEEEAIKRAFSAFDEHAFDDLSHELLYEDGGLDSPQAETDDTLDVDGWFHPMDGVGQGLHPYLHVGDDVVDVEDVLEAGDTQG
jgi:hypothetical protein